MAEVLLRGRRGSHEVNQIVVDGQIDGFWGGIAYLFV